MCGKLSVIMICGLRPYYNDFVHQAIHQVWRGRKMKDRKEFVFE